MNKYELALETLKSEHKKFTNETATSLFGISIDTIIEACEKAEKYDLIQENLTENLSPIEEDDLEGDKEELELND